MKAAQLELLSYYSIRSQAAKDKNVWSWIGTSFGGYTSTYVVMGVPQSTILGPLHFLMFINELCSLWIPIKVIFFVDDTSYRIFYLMI